MLRRFLLAVLALWSSGVAAQTIEILGPPAPIAPAVFAKDDRGRITLRATRLATPLSLDGALDESIYQEVAAIDHFFQQEPDEGAAATEKTLVWLFFDDDFLRRVRSLIRSRTDLAQRVAARQLQHLQQ